MTKILLVQGANLTFLGRREPDIYGTTTPAEIQRHAQKHGYHLDIFYTNVKGEAINHIYQAVDEGADGLVMKSGRIYLRRLRTEGLYQGLSVICVQKVPLRNVWKSMRCATHPGTGAKLGGISACQLVSASSRTFGGEAWAGL